MRWERLFADLDAQFGRLIDAEQRSELADRQRTAAGSLTLLQRLLGAVGTPVAVRTSAGVGASGVVTAVGPDWLLMRAGTADLLAPLAAITAVDGLSAASGPGLTRVGVRTVLRLVLRGLARDRAAVRVTLAEQGSATGAPQLDGTIDRVGADFIELARHPAWEVRRPATVRTVALVPLRGIALVESRALG